MNNKDKIFSVNAYIYKNGMKMLYMANDGTTTVEIFPFDVTLYGKVRKFAMLCAEKNDYFDVHFYPVLKLEDMGGIRRII